MDWTIGFITSTDLPDALQAEFLKGLRGTGWEGDPGAEEGNNSVVSILNYSAKGNYDDSDGKNKKQLYKATENFDRNGGVSLIVAVGGMVSAHAAFKQCRNKLFLVLCGDDPKYSGSGKPQLRGGVNLDLVDSINDRSDAFGQAAGISPARICLVWNKNSKMGKDESHKWQAISPYDVGVDDNDDQAVADAIDQAASTRKNNQLPQGILFSADPFFTSRMNVVVTAANDTKLKVCYPFDVYAKAKPAPAPGSYVVGPDLGAAYQAVGQKAGDILTALQDDVPPEKVPDTGLQKATIGPVKPLTQGSRKKR